MVKRNIVAEVMSEQCIYGGLLATRHEVYCDLVEVARSHGRKPNHLFIDKLTWMPRTATAGEIASLLRAGLTLQAIRAKESP